MALLINSFYGHSFLARVFIAPADSTKNDLQFGGIIVEMPISWTLKKNIQTPNYFNKLNIKILFYIKSWVIFNQKSLQKMTIFDQVFGHKILPNKSVIYIFFLQLAPKKWPSSSIIVKYKLHCRHFIKKTILKRLIQTCNMCVLYSVYTSSFAIKKAGLTLPTN